jgi:methyl-accepting chemotaxis protein
VTKKRANSDFTVDTRRWITRFHMGIALLLPILISGCGQSAAANPLLAHSENAAMREVREIAECAANLLNVYMDARVTEMLICSKSGGPVSDALVMSDATTHANRILDGWLKTSEAYNAIMLLDRKGVCIASAPSSLVNQDLSNHEAFKEAVEGRLKLTDAHKTEILTTLDPKSKAWTVVIAVPVKACDDIAGVLMSCLNLSKLRELLKSIRVGTPFVQEYSTGRAEISTGFVYVLNSKNQTIIHPMEEYCGRTLDEIGAPHEISDAIKKRDSNQRYQFRNPKTGQREVKLAGFAYPQGYGNFPRLGWMVGVSVSEDELIGAPWWMQLFR